MVGSRLVVRRWLIEPVEKHVPAGLADVDQRDRGAGQPEPTTLIVHTIRACCSQNGDWHGVDYYSLWHSARVHRQAHPRGASSRSTGTDSSVGSMMVSAGGIAAAGLVTAAGRRTWLPTCYASCDSGFLRDELLKCYIL